jgi:hypothetical protein
MIDFLQDTKTNLTWANIFVNFNYNAFIELFIPEFKKRDCIIICNEKSNINNLPFKVKKDFRVGNNCIINNYTIIEDIKKYIKDNNIINTIFLFSASSLSEVAIYHLFKDYPNNTYLDIGSTLNYYLGLSIDRDYLLAKWKYKCEYGLSHRYCIW